MRTFTKLLIPFLVLAMVGVADAKGVKKSSTPLVKGTIQSITNGTLTLKAGKNAVGSKKVISTSNQTLVTVNGIGGKHISDLIPGQKVVIKSAADGTALEITATNAASKGKKLRKA